MSDTAGAAGPVSMASSSKSASSKLESLTREDLIKFVKKQAVTIKSLRNKDSSLEQAVVPGSQLELAEEYSVLKSERDVLFQKFSALSSEKNSLEIKYAQLKHQEDARQLVEAPDTGAGQEVTFQSLHSQVQLLQQELSRSEKECSSLKSKLSGEAVQKEDSQLEASEQRLRLLDLELADYQANSKQLAEENSRLKDKLRISEGAMEANATDREAMLQRVRELESDKTGLATERDNLRTQIGEERAGSERLKSELDAEKRSLEGVREEMEQVRCKWEEDKLHSQELEVKVHQIEGTSKARVQEQVDALDKLEYVRSGLEAELKESHTAYNTSVSEYENYKIRVHGVLKQKSELVSAAQQLQERIASLETADKEQLSLMEKKDKQVLSLEGELSRLRGELKLEEEGRFRSERASLSRVESLQMSKNEQISKQVDEIHRLHELVAALRLTEQQMEQSYAHQIQSMQREHQEKMISLQQENLRLQNLIQAEEVDELPPCGSQERTQGEGMERELLQLSMKPDSTPHSPTGSARGFYLGRLLSSGPEEPAASPEPIVDQTDTLAQEVTAGRRQLRHLSEILRESEGTNMLLELQVKLLKEEIRRLERNTARGKHLESLEYLKNVVVRFFSSSSCQADMLPALQTLLQLGPEEVEAIKSEILSVARAKKAAADSASFAWSSYDPTNINIV